MPHEALASTPCGLVFGGVVPFLGLRTPKSQAEMKLLNNAIEDDLQVLPASPVSILATLSANRIKIQSILGSRTSWKTGSERAPGYNGTSRSAAKATAQNIANRAALVHVAVVILRSAAQDYNCSEAYTRAAAGLDSSDAIFERHINDDEIIQSVAKDERSVRAQCAIAQGDERASQEHDLPEVRNPRFLTLATTFKVLRRPFDVSDIGKWPTRTNMNELARSVLNADSADDAAQCALSHPLFDALSPTSRMTLLGKCVDANSGLLVIERDAEGQFGETVLINKDVRVRALCADAIRRCYLQRSIVIVLVDADQTISRICDDDAERFWTLPCTKKRAIVKEVVQDDEIIEKRARR